MTQITAAPGNNHDNRPPVVRFAPPPGVAAAPRRTTHQRRAITPHLWDAPPAGPGTYPSNHPYVRKYWTATIGPGAVADLLRLATAAQRGRSLRRPTYLHVLIRAGLVHVDDHNVYVRTHIPRLSPHQIKRLPPDLRRHHPETAAK